MIVQAPENPQRRTIAEFTSLSFPSLRSLKRTETNSNCVQCSRISAKMRQGAILCVHATELIWEARGVCFYRQSSEFFFSVTFVWCFLSHLLLKNISVFLLATTSCSYQWIRV